MKKTLSIIILLFLLQLNIGHTQSTYIGSPYITNFSRSDYQAGTQNWAIKQDKRGIMYFGNNKGLLEFDGTNWQTFELPNHTIVRSISFDTEGRVCVGGQAEFGYLKPNDEGKNIYTSLTHLIPEELQGFEDIWQILVHPEGVYFCSEKAIFRLKDEQIKLITPGSGRFENFFELDGEIYIQDKTQGLLALKGDQFQSVQNGDIFANLRITAILPHQEDQSLIFTYSKGLFLMDKSGIRPWQTESSNFLTTYQAYCAIQLKDGRYAIGTSQNGLLIMDKAGMPMIHLNQEKGLQNNTILSICQDTQQNLWLGLDNGIDYAEINSPFSIIRSEAGIEGTGYASIIHQGKLYLGTNQGLFYTDWNEKNNPMELQKFKPVQNAVGQVWNINQLGNSMVLSQHKGASYLNGQQVIPFSSIPGAWKFMELDANPGYAIEGTYAGLVLYKNQNLDNENGDTPDWKFVRNLEGFNESARVFEQDDDGNIWVSHAYKGLFKIKLSGDLQSIEKINFYNSDQGLPGDISINVAKIRGELIFTTPKGIFRYEKEKDRFVLHEEFTGLFGENRNVHRLLEDETGNIWFSIDKDFGVLKVQEKGVFNKLELAYFNQIHEDLVDGFEHVYAYNQNNVFIGTEKGFVHYNPMQNKNIDFPFKILIRKVTSITHTDSIVYWGNLTEGFKKENLGFNYQINDFRFAFSAPYYEKINFLRYRFMLEGFEDSWSEWTTKTEKEYTNLPHGDYHFKVQARNAFGQISSVEGFSFTIFPPWYFSIYAKVGYFIIGLISLISLVQFISKREKEKTEVFKLEQTKKLEKKESEFKKEVEKSEGEIIRLRNEKLRDDIKNKNSQLASTTMHLVQKSEMLMKIKGDLNNLVSEASPDFKRKIEQISRTIEADIRLDNNWEQFEFHFDQVHENFFKRLRQQFPQLTPKDQKLCAYLRMNLTTKEIAPLLNISVRGVEISRYRLRKKLELDSDTNLIEFMINV